MRSKNVRRSTPEPQRVTSSRTAMAPGAGRGRLILAVIALLAIGAALGVIGDRAVSREPGASPTPSAALESSSPSPTNPSGSSAPSASPSPSPSPPSPALEAMMPKSVDGATLTIQSLKDVASLGSGPASRALGAAITALGKKPTDFEFAAASDDSGAIKLQILGFRVPGLDPAKLEPVILHSYLAADVSGVKTSSVTLATYTSTKVSYGDGGNDEYVLVYRDGLLLIETPDPAQAQRAASALGGGTVAAPSPSPTASAAPSGSAAPSASTSESPSPSPS